MKKGGILIISLRLSKKQSLNITSIFYSKPSTSNGARGVGLLYLTTG
ncbi:unnamed protein product [marine sediment metagenome]|uniref:Uncharacterized protein n=1 Tax=marine sediment metagenome TaxID=412755 RepID=X1CJ04_9ZZZZ